MTKYERWQTERANQRFVKPRRWDSRQCGMRYETPEELAKTADYEREIERLAIMAAYQYSASN